MSWKMPPLLASEEWCTVPFAISGKTAYDLLDDIFLQVPAAVILRTRWKGLVASGMDRDAEMLAPEVAAAGRVLLRKLDAWWNEHIEEINNGSAHRHISPPLSPSDPESSPSPTSNFVVPKIFNDTFHAQTISKFNAICMAAFGMIRLVSTGVDFRKEITLHGESILSAYRYHERAGVAHTGAISMLHQLIVLYYQAVTRKQREAAKSALLTWGKPRGIGKFVGGTVAASPSGYGRLETS